MVRVLALGDSVTFGSKVDDGEPFPSVLETLLNRGGGAPRYQVVNAGVPGYSAFQQLRDLRRDLVLAPDVVLVQFTLNDVTEPFELLRRYGGRGGKDGLTDVPRVAGWLAEHSALYRFLRDLIARVRFGTATRSGVERRAGEEQVYRVTNLVRRADDPRIVEAWAEYLRWLSKILDTCRAERLRCIVLATPWRFQLPLAPEANRPHRFLEATLARRGVEFLDLLPPIQERVRRDALAERPLDPQVPLPRLAAEGALPPPALDLYWYRYFVDYDHFSARGHRWLAEQLARRIADAASARDD